MFVTLFSSFLQISSRNNYFISSIDWHCKEIYWRNVNIMTNHCWSWKFQSKCDDNENWNAKTKEVRRQKNICEDHENENFVENLDFDRCKRYLQINIMKRSIFRAKQKQRQKQQNDIDFANVCCFKLLEFEFFEFLLIDRFWLIANVETKDRLTTTTTTKSWWENDLNWLNSKFTLTFVFQLFMLLFSYRCNKFIF